MKLPVVILLLLFSACLSADSYTAYQATVVKVIDGDTIQLDVAIWPGLTQRISLGLNGIDTPEKRGLPPCEKEFAKKVGSKYAIATVNGTAALHVSLLLADVKAEDEVITQPLTFIATCNAISYIGAKPIFVDIDLDTMGLSPK